MVRRGVRSMLSRNVPQLRPGGLRRHIRSQFMRLRRGIAERKFLGVSLQKEIERIDHRHFRDQIDFDGEMLHRFWKDQARQIIALRVLLPVDEVAGRFDLQRVRGDRRAAVRSGPQANHLRRETYQAVVLVIRLVMQRNTYGHESIPYDRSAAGSRRRFGCLRGPRVRFSWQSSNAARAFSPA